MLPEDVTYAYNHYIYIYYLHSNVLIFSYHVLVTLNYATFGTAVTQKRLQRETRRRSKDSQSPQRLFGYGLAATWKLKGIPADPF